MYSPFRKLQRKLTARERDNARHKAWCLEKMQARVPQKESVEERDAPLQLCKTYHRKLLKEIEKEFVK